LKSTIFPECKSLRSPLSSSLSEPEADDIISLAVFFRVERPNAALVALRSRQGQLNLPPFLLLVAFSTRADSVLRRSSNLQVDYGDLYDIMTFVRSSSPPFPSCFVASTRTHVLTFLLSFFILNQFRGDGVHPGEEHLAQMIADSGNAWSLSSWRKVDMVRSTFSLLPSSLILLPRLVQLTPSLLLDLAFARS